MWTVNTSLTDNKYLGSPELKGKKKIKRGLDGKK